jgi:protein ImuA
MPDSILSLRPAAPLAPSLSAPGRVALGIAEMDAWLAGGLRRDALHEAYATAREDSASTMALALLVAWLNARDGQRDKRPIIWARALSGPSLPYGPGLIDLGIDPAIVTLLLLPDSRAVLRAALDSVRQGAAGSVLIELCGRQPLLDLTATRRLALAAQEHATMVWLVRGEAQPVPSAAQTRWQVRHAPTAAAGTRPAFDLTLLRQRGGREGWHIRMEWDRDTASFQQSADQAGDQTSGTLPGLEPAVAAGGTGGARGERAA